MASWTWRAKLFQRGVGFARVQGGRDPFVGQVQGTGPDLDHLALFPVDVDAHHQPAERRDEPGPDELGHGQAGRRRDHQAQ